MKPLRAGLIGLGMMGRHHMRLLDQIDGNTQEVEAGLAVLNSREKKELVEIFKSLLGEHEWISGIAQTSLELLGEEPQKKKGLFRR